MDASPTPLPYRGRFGARRPAGLPRLPPEPMPSHHGLTALKAWRYVGLFGAEWMICAAEVRVGPFRQAFYAVYDRQAERLHERTATRVGLGLSTGRLRIDDAELQLDVRFAEGAGVETVSAMDNHAYAWTRKQAGLPAAGRIRVGRHAEALELRAIIDDSAGYHPHRTAWRWCAGVGTSAEGRELAWNLVEGLHDHPTDSERTLWVDGTPEPLPPTAIARDLTSAGELRFTAEVTRERREQRIILASRLRQPFGTFSGTIAGHPLAEGYGVMEDHQARW